MEPYLVTPKGVSGAFGMDYKEVLKRFKASGLAIQVGRNWYLPTESIDQYITWELTLMSASPNPSV